MLASSLISLAALTVAFTSSSVSAAARLEQPDGTIILAGWLDTDVQQPEGGDSFTLFNQRIGRRAGAFQLAQTIPLTPSPWAVGDFLYANMSLFDEGSDASLFLTVYPEKGFDAIQDSDVTYLADQVYNITQGGRNVYIRYAPEMQGNWMAYGGQPAAFIESFRRISTAIHARTPTAAAMVWSPNLEQKDDAGSIYPSYYPGDEYVDFVGLSVYFKGVKGEYPWIKTGLCPDNFFAEIIDGLGGQGPTFSFYDTYSRKLGKPFVLSEGAAAYHIEYKTSESAPFTPAVEETTRAGVQMSFWNTFLFNSTFRAAYPLVKMVNLFEFQKNENELGTIIHRDFRATRNPESLAAFKAQLDVFDAGFTWAKAVSRPTSVTTTTATTTAARTSTSAPVVVTSSTSVAATKTGGAAQGVKGLGIGLLGVVAVLVGLVM